VVAVAIGVAVVVAVFICSTVDAVAIAVAVAVVVTVAVAVLGGSSIDAVGVLIGLPEVAGRSSKTSARSLAIR
jgi:hypothetical protein